MIVVIARTSYDTTTYRRVGCSRGEATSVTGLSHRRLLHYRALFCRRLLRRHTMFIRQHRPWHHYHYITLVTTLHARERRMATHDDYTSATLWRINNIWRQSDKASH